MRLVDRARRQVAARRVDDALQAIVIAEQVEQAAARPRDLVVVDAARRLPSHEVVEHRAHGGMPLERDHLRRRALAGPRRQPGERGARSLEEPVVEHRDLEPHADAIAEQPEPVADQPHQPTQPLGRHQHQRADPPALRVRPSRELGHPVERDQRLADAGLAVEHQRHVAAEIDGRLLLGVEHRQHAPLDLADVRWGRAHDRLVDQLLALASHGPVFSQQSPRLDHPAFAHRAARHPPPARRAIAGIELVALARAVAEEHPGQRRRAPVEHRWLAVEPRARPEHVLAAAPIGVDHQPATHAVARLDHAVDGVRVHSRQSLHSARSCKLPTSPGDALRSCRRVAPAPNHAKSRRCGRDFRRAARPPLPTLRAVGESCPVS